MLDLGGANAEGESTECAVGGGVGVAADDRHAWLGDAQLRADDVDDALIDVTERVQSDAEVLRILTQCLDLLPRGRVGDRLEDVERRGVVILSRQCQIRTAHLTPSKPEALKCLRARDLVHEMQIDVEQVRFTFCCTYDVRVPDFLAQGFPHSHTFQSRHVLRTMPTLPARETCSPPFETISLSIWTKLVAWECSTKQPPYFPHSNDSR